MSCYLTKVNNNIVLEYHIIKAPEENPLKTWIPEKEPSWQAMNKGKLSKKARRKL